MPRPVCRICLRAYDPGDTTDLCRFHVGSWAGFEKGKLHGTSTSDPELQHIPKIVYHWDCCGEPSKSSPGCVVGPHESFD